MNALPKLHLGDKNYSSWSMRPWLALKHGNIPFEEVNHVLPEVHPGEPVFKDVSPNGKVPALDLGTTTISESLAICEWAAEQAPNLWPSDSVARAEARAAASIMHAGFPHLRNDAPMNMRRVRDAACLSPEALNDAKRMDALWSGWLTKYNGPFLFGGWSIADAMYAPAASRFETYTIPRSDAADVYIKAVLSEPHAAEWRAGADVETSRLHRVDTH